MTRFARTALAVAAALTLALSGCAGDPESSDGEASTSAGAAGSATASVDGAAGGGRESADNGSASSNGATADGRGKANPPRTDQAPDPEEATRTVTELPEGFPVDAFAVPKGASIYDARERSASEWYVVLRTDDAADARATWQRVIDDNEFDVEDVADDGEAGLSATLTNAGVTVDAVTAPQADGTVLLSYELSAN